MKKLSILSFLLLITLSVFAQETDFNKIVPDRESRPKTYEDYLVQLAWNNSPTSKALNNNQKIAELEVDLTKREWMENLSVQWNVNEISLSNIIYPDNELFVALPIWNVTATVDLNTVFNRKKRIEISKEKLEITSHNVNNLKLQLRAMVLERYQSYLFAIEILKIRTEGEQEASETRILLKELFKEDKADFEEFSRASDIYIKAKEGKTSAEMDVELARIALEEIIGVKYEEAEKYGKAYKKK